MPESAGLDALGQITAAVEDPGSSPHLNAVTSYTYNALDALTTETQAGQRRTFTHDGRGLLLTATHPTYGRTHPTYGRMIG